MKPPENGGFLRVEIEGNMKARKANLMDLKCVADLAMALWPGHDEDAFTAEMAEYISAREKAAFLMEEGRTAIGLALCSLRHDYVEGAEESPVGYLEGVYVDEAYRGRGAARALLDAAQQWAKELGCRQFASDCELANQESLAFHLACGFEEANRIICFVKDL